MNALRALLGEIVDYAGLFPPSAVDMETAVRNYESYRADDASWMLGRFVVPVARLDELQAAWDRLDASPKTLSISAVLSANTIADIDRVHVFNATNDGRMQVASIEAKLTSADAIREACARVDAGIELFAEIPTGEDPLPLVSAMSYCGANAKMRTGGVTADAFPPAHDIVRFMRRCTEHGVRFKATAGLHHPLCADYRLTYEDGAACGAMYGFLNVFLAAVLMASGAGDADAERMVVERDASTLAWSDGAITWGEHRLTSQLLRHTRQCAAVSFGSCSFREPVDELRALGILS